MGTRGDSGPQQTDPARDAERASTCDDLLSQASSWIKTTAGV